MPNVTELEAEAARIAAELKAAKKSANKERNAKRRAGRSLDRWYDKHVGVLSIEQQGRVCAVVEELDPVEGR